MPENSHDNMHEDDEASYVFDLLARSVRQSLKNNRALAAQLRLRAIRRGRRAVQSRPSARLWLLLGDAYVKWQSSEECYQKALALEPRNGEAAYELAKIQFRNRGNLTKAMQLLSLAVKWAPLDIRDDVYRLASEVYESAGKPGLAAEAKKHADLYWKGWKDKTIRDLDKDWDKPDRGG